MWFEFSHVSDQPLTFHSDKSGKDYEAWVAYGDTVATKDFPSAPKMLKLFNNSSVTIIEDDGSEIPDISALDFFKNHAVKGSTYTLTYTNGVPKLLTKIQRGRIGKDWVPGQNAEPKPYTPPEYVSEQDKQTTQITKVSTPVQYGSWEKANDDTIPF